MIDFIPLPYKLAGLALAMVICAVLGYMKGYENANDKYLAFKADVAQQTAILEANAEKARLETDRITADVSKAWAAALDHARANPRTIRVSAGCDSTGLRPLSTPAEGLNGASLSSGEERTITTEQCEAVANDSLLDDQWIRLVKEWVKQQSEVQR